MYLNFPSLFSMNCCCVMASLRTLWGERGRERGRGEGEGREGGGREGGIMKHNGKEMRKRERERVCVREIGMKGAVD